MPLLWGDAASGWANVSTSKGGLSVDPGFVESRPTDPGFKRELEAEVERLRTFLVPRGAGLATQE